MIAFMYQEKQAAQSCRRLLDKGGVVWRHSDICLPPPVLLPRSNQYLADRSGQEGTSCQCTAGLMESVFLNMTDPLTTLVGLRPANLMLSLARHYMGEQG
jgi:hypothetical protein